MSTAVEIIINGRDNTGGAFGSVSGGLARIGQIATGILASQVFLGIARQVESMVFQGFEAIASYERLGASLETLAAREMINSGAAATMTEALAMSGDKAKELLDWTQKLAIQSPFTQEGVAEAFRTALAYGFTSDQAQRLTQATIDFAAGSGASVETMNRIALALGQIQAKGKLSGQEILQLVNAGLPVTQILAKAFGKTTAEISKMTSDGLIPADKAIEAITASLENDFGGAAARQATTWAGLKGTFEDIKNIGLRKLFQGVADVLQPLAISYSNWLQNEGMVKIEKMGKDLGELVKVLTGIADGFGKANSITSQFFNTAIKPMLPALRSIMDTFEKMRPSIEKTAGALGGRLLEAGKELASKVMPFLVEKLGDFAAWFAENRPLIEQYAAMLGERFAFIADAVVGFWDVVEPLLSGVMDLILELVELSMQLATGDWQGAWETMGDIVNTTFETIGTTLEEFFDWIAGLMGGSLKEIERQWTENGNQLKQIVSQAWTIIKNTISTKLAEAKAYIVSTLTAVGAAVLSGLSSIRNTFSSVFTAIQSVVSTAFNSIKAAISSAISSVSTTISSGLNGIKNLFTSAWSSIVSGVSGLGGSLITSMTTALGAVKTAITGILTSFIEIGESIIKNIIAGLKNNVSALISYLKGIITDLVKKMVSGSANGSGGGGTLAPNDGRGRPDIGGLAPTMGGILSTVRSGSAQAANSQRTVNNYYNPHITIYAGTEKRGQILKGLV